MENENNTIKIPITLFLAISAAVSTLCAVLFKFFYFSYFDIPAKFISLNSNEILIIFCVILLCLMYFFYLVSRINYFFNFVLRGIKFDSIRTKMVTKLLVVFFSYFFIYKVVSGCIYGFTNIFFLETLVIVIASLISFLLLSLFVSSKKDKERDDVDDFFSKELFIDFHLKSFFGTLPMVVLIGVVILPIFAGNLGFAYAKFSRQMTVFKIENTEFVILSTYHDSFIVTKVYGANKIFIPAPTMLVSEKYLNDSFSVLAQSKIQPYFLNSKIQERGFLSLIFNR